MKAKVFVTTLGLLSFAGTAHAAFTREPWVQDATASSVAIYWEGGSSSGTQRLEYGDGFAQQVAGTNIQFNLFKAVVTGLTPSTSFQYRVVSNSDTSVTGTFSTAPSGVEPFRFGAYGDNRTNNADHSAVVAQLVTQAPDFVINAGDLVDFQTYTTFFSLEKALLRNIPLFPSPGNHDFGAFYQFGFDRPNYYTFRWSNAYFICVSTADDTSVGSTQYGWLETKLQEASQDPTVDWIIAYHHFPVYSSANHGSTPGMDATINALYKQYDVDLVFNSHDHVYERIERDDIQYIVTGGGGAPLYDFDAPVAGSLVREKALHAVIVDIDGGVLDLKAVKPDGTTIDTLHIEKATGEPTPTPTPTGTGTPGPTPTPTPGNPGDPGPDAGGCNVGGFGGGSLSLALLALAGLLIRRR